MSIDTRYKQIDNYIYLFHTDTFIVVPAFVDNITDSLGVNFASETPLSRTAPIYSYQNSGPRTVRILFNLHRDMMKEINYGVSNAPVDLSMPNNDDYVDYMIKAIQAAALPSYDAANKMVNPPVVAARIGSDIFIKGVVTGGVEVNYSYPIIENGKYATVNMGITISEIDPYQASDVLQMGSYRGVPKTLERFTYQDFSK